MYRFSNSLGGARLAAPAPAPEEDLPPRIVAIIPHRSDREIADEIWAKLLSELEESGSDARPEQEYGIGNLFEFIGSAQAQARGRSGRRNLEPGSNSIRKYMLSCNAA